MHFKKGLLAALAVSVMLSAPAEAQKKPKKGELTAMEIQALQSKEFETTKEVLFASVVSVLQDLGYQLSNADMSSGFITAASPMKNKTGLFEAFAGVQGSGNTKVTAFVEQIGSMARVRLNFVNAKTSSSNWGRQSAEDKPVLDPQTYRVAWEKVDEAVFVRSATKAVASPGTPAEQTAAPAAISIPVTADLKVSTNTPAPATAKPAGTPTPN